MTFTMVAIICHIIGSLSVPVCHEEIIDATLSMQACVMSQAIVADWKTKSIYSDEQWIVSGIKCVPGTYYPKDAI